LSSSSSFSSSSSKKDARIEDEKEEEEEEARAQLPSPRSFEGEVRPESLGGLNARLKAARAKLLTHQFSQWSKTGFLASAQLALMTGEHLRF